MTKNKMERVAIIGGGLIGKCWAVLFVKSGYAVNLYDVLFTDNKGAVEAALQVISGKLVELKEYGLLSDDQVPEELVKNVTPTDNLKSALTGVLYVQECIPENVEMKKELFKQLDELVEDDSIILASSSSCIVPSRFTSDLKHRQNCIVAHPLNPPHYTPLVEVLPSPFTSEDTLSRTMAILKRLGQSPIHVKKEVNGFVVNRLQYALIMEAWRLVNDGVASPEDVDKAISEGLGLRYSFMGPFEVMHLNATGMQQYCELYGENITRVCETQTQAHSLSGPTLETIRVAMEAHTPLESLNERRKWRDERLASLAAHKKEMSKKD